ncbi:MAG: diacylglycerol kinase [Gammaproteobacteria bacterium]|nr:diacylglycerol kinase [Gammaproteobacteria bacterium]
MNKKYWTQIIHAFTFSCQGLLYALKRERAFQQELMLAAVLIPIAFWLEVSQLERILLVASMLWILIIELLNSSIETAIDRIGLEHHSLSKLSKDLSSAAVMMSFILMFYIWVSILKS